MSEQKIEELRIATREANETLRDLKTILRDLKHERAEIEKMIETQFDKKISVQVADTLASYNETIKEAMQAGVDHVLNEFDKLEGIMLGTDPKSKRAGKASLPELVQRKADLQRGQS